MMDSPLALVVFGNCYVRELAGPEVNQLIPQPTCWAYCEIAGDIRVRFGKEWGEMIALCASYETFAKQNKPEEQNFHQKGARNSSIRLEKASTRWYFSCSSQAVQIWRSQRAIWAYPLGFSRHIISLQTPD